MECSETLQCQSIHAMDIVEVMDTLPLKFTPITVPGHSCFLYDLDVTTLLKVFIFIWALLVSGLFPWKEPFPLSEQGPNSRPNQQEIDLCVCHRSMRLCPCSVVLLVQVHGWNDVLMARGEEALLAFTAEDRSVAKTRRRTGMPTYLSVENNQRWGNGRKIKFLWRDVSSKFNAGTIFFKQRTFCFYPLWPLKTGPASSLLCVFFFYQSVR